MNLIRPMRLYEHKKWDIGPTTGFDSQFLIFRKRSFLTIGYEQCPYKISPSLLLQIGWEPAFELLIALPWFTINIYILAKNYDFY